MGLRIEASKATVTRVTSARTRAMVAGGATGTAACCAMLMWLGPAWALWVGAIGIALCALGGALAAMPDERIVFDAHARQVTIARRYPWQPTETERVVPFPAVHSIGVNRVGDSHGGYDYSAVLRLNGGRNVDLWGINPGRRSDRDLIRFIETDPDLARLQEFTGLRREDRITRQGWFD